jgi:serine O-acetyltransferase
MVLIKKISWWSDHLFKAVKGMTDSVLYYKNLKLYFSNHLTVGIPYLKRQNTIFPHPVGIVIGQKVKLGKNCKIYQNVTIGTKETANYESASYPIIGNNVTVYANSVIFGNISIGDNVVIGAGSIVFQDVPENSVATGNPCRVVSSKI